MAAGRGDASRNRLGREKLGGPAGPQYSPRVARSPGFLHHLRRQRHHAAARLWTRSGAQRPEGARDAVLHEPHLVHLALPGSSCCGRTVTRMPSPSVESMTSAQRSALTSLRRIPAMNSSPAITASRRRARGRPLQTRRPAHAAPAGGTWRARRPGPRPRNGRACPRPRSPAVRRYPASTRAVRSPAGVCCPASFARKHAAATAIEALEDARPAACGSAR